MAFPAPPARADTPPRRARWQAGFTVAAVAVALLGVAGLIPILRPATPTPPSREPVRYASGSPIADRLVILLAPQIDASVLPDLQGALQPGATEPATTFTVGRPTFLSFDEVSLALLAGDVPSAASPTAPTDQPTDTLVRSVIGQGRRATLVGPPEWRAIFAMGDPVASASAAAPKTEALLGEAAATLATRDAALVVVLLRDLTARDLRDDPTGLRGAVTQLGAQLGPRDALLLVADDGPVGEPLTLTLSGAGVRSAPPRTLPFNDVAPTCAVLLGAPYPSATRGRLAWAMLAADERRKAEATAGLARQRTWVAVGAVPFGVPYSSQLRTLTLQLTEDEAEIAAGRYAYGYQLASSNLDIAERELASLAGAVPVPLPRRAAWWLAVPCFLVALLAIGAIALARRWATLAAGLAGGLVALVVWLGIAIFLQRGFILNLGTVLALTGIHALAGGLFGAWMARRWGGARPGLAIDLLALLAVLPAAACAYRYGLPWRLRPEEAAPLFLWRSALLAPVALLMAGYGGLWGLGRGRWSAERGTRSAE